MVEEIKSASENPPNMSVTANKPKESAPLSFSISRILGVPADDTKTREVSREELPRVPKMHVATIHHFGADEAVNYQHFEAQVQPRACSTPENDYPSPTPAGLHDRLSLVANPHQPTIGSAYNSPSFEQGSAYISTNYGQFFAVPKSRDHFPTSRDETDRPHVATSTPEPTEEGAGIPTMQNLEQSSDKSLDSMGESYHQSPSPFKSKKKKTRTVFSRNQVYQLESAFEMKRYLSSAERAGLAASLNLSETQIKIWFQNRRNKWKRQINGEMDEIPIPPAFAASYLQSQFAHPPSLNSYSHVTDSRDNLLRSSLTVPAYYSHPYARPAFYITSSK